VLGQTIGVRATLLVAAIGGCVAVFPVYFSPLRRMRELPSYVSDSEIESPLVESDA
jgi:hypothetical protein